MKILGLVGQNIAYSKSPVIHKYISDKYHLDYHYELIDTMLLDSIITDLNENKYLGLNVTVPYKEKIIPFLDDLDSLAKHIKVVNLAVNKDNSLIGYNTDYYGFKFLLEKNNVTLENKNIYILGNGASARTIKYLLETKSCHVTLVIRNNTTHQTFGDYCYYDELTSKQIDIIINTTPHHTQIKRTYFNEQTLKNALLIDINYEPRPTSLMAYFKKSIDGIDMLIYQAFKTAQIIFNNKMIECDEEDIKKIKEII